MIRTVVSLESKDKKWLDKQAHLRHISMTALVREAVHYYRKKIESEHQPSFEELLLKTAGLWKKGDGLDFQQKLREEWD